MSNDNRQNFGGVFIRPGETSRGHGEVIKTYRPTNKPTGSLMEQHEHGDWVKASYAVMLEAETARLTAELARVEKERDQALSAQSGLMRDNLAYAAQIGEMQDEIDHHKASYGSILAKAESRMEELGGRTQDALAMLGRVRVERKQLSDERDAALTRAKSAEDRCDRLRAECLAWRAWLTKFRSVLEGGHLSSPVDTSGVELARAACDTHHDLDTPTGQTTGGE